MNKMYFKQVAGMEGMRIITTIRKAEIANQLLKRLRSGVVRNRIRRHSPPASSRINITQRMDRMILGSMLLFLHFY